MKTSPGLPLVKEKKLNLRKCVICQYAKVSEVAKCKGKRDDKMQR